MMQLLRKKYIFESWDIEPLRSKSCLEKNKNKSKWNV